MSEHIVRRYCLIIKRPENADKKNQLRAGFLFNLEGIINIRVQNGALRLAYLEDNAKYQPSTIEFLSITRIEPPPQEMTLERQI
jgi:hypothetical protein